MIFNFWRPCRFFRPRKDGWYLCTTEHGGGLNRPRVLLLYFHVWNKTWVDDRRQSVFDGYKVYESGRAPIDENRVFGDRECERIDILAWKKLPRRYRFGRRKRAYE